MARSTKYIVQLFNSKRYIIEGSSIKIGIRDQLIGIFEGDLMILLMPLSEVETIFLDDPDLIRTDYQPQAQTNYEEAHRFIEALQAALADGTVVASSNLSSENRIGWQADGFLFMLHEAFEMVNRWLVNQGQLPIRLPTRDLRYQLYASGFTQSSKARIKQGDYDRQLTDPVDDKRRLVTAIYLDRLFPAEAES